MNTKTECVYQIVLCWSQNSLRVRSLFFFLSYNRRDSQAFVAFVDGTKHDSLFERTRQRGSLSFVIEELAFPPK